MTPEKTVEEWVEYCAEVCDSVEFLHGVPVQLPNHTKALLRGRVREALTQYHQDRMSDLLESLEGMKNGIEEALGIEILGDEMESRLLGIERDYTGKKYVIYEDDLSSLLNHQSLDTLTEAQTIIKSK